MRASVATSQAEASRRTSGRASIEASGTSSGCQTLDPVSLHAAKSAAKSAARSTRGVEGGAHVRRRCMTRRYRIAGASDQTAQAVSGAVPSDDVGQQAPGDETVNRARRVTSAATTTPRRPHRGRRVIVCAVVDARVVTDSTCRVASHDCDHVSGGSLTVSA